MARGKNQKCKLYHLIEYFKKYTDEEHTVTVAELIEYLGEQGIAAERKSIYRDIETMGDLGYEIIQVHGKRFSYYLADRDFETAELRTLVDAVASSRFITKKKSGELIKKLESLANIHVAGRLNAQVFVANRIKSSNESIYYNVDAIHNAIADNSRITFMYYDWDKNKRRVYRHNGKVYEVSPWALVWNNENYYLVAYDNEVSQIKHYRVDRMISISQTGKTRQGKAAYSEQDTAQYTKKFFGMYDGELSEVTLNCSESITNAVVDMFGTDVNFYPQSDNKTFNVTVEVALSPVFLSWVFMLGDNIRIVSPQKVIDEYKTMVKRSLENMEERLCH